MVDSGLMQSGYVSVAGTRLWLVLTSETLADAKQGLGDLSVVQDGSVSFTTVAVSAARFRQVGRTTRLTRARVCAAR